MDIYEIISFQSVGGLKFGWSPAKVRKHLGCEFRSFNRAATQPHPTDQFVKVGVFAYYNGLAKLEAVEMASPARAIFQGCDISALKRRELIALLRGQDPDLRIDRDGLTSQLLGVSAWTPDAKENPNAPVESVLAFARQYHEANDNK